MAIELRNLVKRYPGGVTALNDITLTIPIGMYGLLGHNGAGKTTLMRILATLLRPDAGQVTVFGHDVVREPQAVRRLLGYVPQKVGFYPQLTAAEMLELVAAYKGVPKDRLRPAIAEALELVNLHEFRRRPVRAISGGMLRRLAIAQAVLGDPKVIVVDEPTAGLDPEERLRLRNLLVELSVSRSVLLSTHIVEDIEDTCPTVSVLRRGSLCFEGSVPDLVRRADGRIWTARLPVSEYERRKGDLCIISARSTPEGVGLRLLSPERPLPDASPAAPTLEDAYFALMRQGAVG
ncbi:ABC transporter ATP-binding protein [Symbiobacterium terraclitae]|uniref:ABC transporter ATP-binding protein n=1 Tax=Symbiobacterium terraclitae TaxID=557451 RepID=UPI0035B50BE4